MCLMYFLILIVFRNSGENWEHCQVLLMYTAKPSKYIYHTGDSPLSALITFMLLDRYWYSLLPVGSLLNRGKVIQAKCHNQCVSDRFRHSLRAIIHIFISSFLSEVQKWYKAKLCDPLNDVLPCVDRGHYLVLR